MKEVRIRIDQAHSAKLAKGEPVSFKVPKGTEVVQVRLSAPAADPLMSSIAKCMDVFFNGRKA